MNCSEECYMVALIYIHRLSQNDIVSVDTRSIHRLYITALVIAAKLYDDVFFKNSYYSRVGGLNQFELNFLEAQLIAWLEYKLLITKETYDWYKKNINKIDF